MIEMLKIILIGISVLGLLILSPHNSRGKKRTPHSSEPSWVDIFTLDIHEERLKI